MKKFNKNNSQGSINLELALMIAIIVLSFSFSIIFLSGRLNNTFVTAGKIIHNIPLLGGTGNGTVEDDKVPNIIGDFNTGKGPGGHYTDPAAPVPVEDDWSYRSNGDGTWTADKYHGSATLASVPYTHNGGVVNKVKHYDQYNNDISVFYSNTVITEIYIPDTITTIGRSAFRGCKTLKKVNIPAGVNLIDYAAFRECIALENIALPGTVKTIGDYAFMDCDALKTGVLNYGTTTLGNSTFNGCNSLTSFIFADTITTMGDGTLSLCTNLTTVSLPKKITAIPTMTCYACKSLVSVAIPASVTTIKDQAFAECSALRKVFMPGDNLVTNWGFLHDSDLYATYYNQETQKYKTIHYIYISDYSISIDKDYVG